MRCERVTVKRETWPMCSWTFEPDVSDQLSDVQLALGDDADFSASTTFLSFEMRYDSYQLLRIFFVLLILALEWLLGMRATSSLPPSRQPAVAQRRGVLRPCHRRSGHFLQVSLLKGRGSFSFPAGCALPRVVGLRHLACPPARARLRDAPPLSVGFAKRRREVQSTGTSWCVRESHLGVSGPKVGLPSELM